MNALLLIKLLLVPALIALITGAAHRWGPAVAGWLSGFPVVAGPLLLFMALERGADFAAQAAVGTLSAVPPILCFGLAYAWVATRLSWPASLAAALGAYAIALLVLNALAPAVPLASALTTAGVLLAPRLFPGVGEPDGSGPPRRPEVLLRMIAGATLVLLVTHYAAALGPRLSGMLAMFPVMASVLAVFSQRRSGATFTVILLRGMVWGYWAFAGFCLALALLLPGLGIAWSFGIALGCSSLVQLGTGRFIGGKAA